MGLEKAKGAGASAQAEVVPSDFPWAALQGLLPEPQFTHQEMEIRMLDTPYSQLGLR